MGSFSIWHWLIVLLIIVLIFGTRKLGNIGTDLSKVVRDFRKGLRDGDDKDVRKDEEPHLQPDDSGQPAAKSTEPDAASADAPRDRADR